MTDAAVRKLNPDSPVLGRIASLETRLARTRAEIRKAQRLRYDVFYGEMAANPSLKTRLFRRDKDPYDKYCDHLLVFDQDAGRKKVVGTYRILLDRHAKAAGGFYSQNEFDLEPMFKANEGRRFMELGRSCIVPEYRSRRTMELLWQGNWAYALENNVDVMFGCASFDGVDPSAFASSFAWLADNVIQDEQERCSSHHRDSINLAEFSGCRYDERRTVAALPPLIKGYLRVGAKIGSHAYIDHQFGTIDVLVVLKVSDINPRYLAHYGADASRFAA